MGEGGMSVDTFWKRVPADVIAGCSPKELSDLVPYYCDDEYTVERNNGTLVAAGDNGALIDVLFWAGASTASQKALVNAYAQAPADWDEDYMVGTLTPDTVAQMSAFLTDAPLAHWVQEHRAALIAEARRLGYRGPFDDAWAGHLLASAQELAALFRAATLANETIIVTIVA
jgi:hypothetical protein